MCVCREQTHTHTLISHDDYVLKIVFLLKFLFSSFAFIIYYSHCKIKFLIIFFLVAGRFLNRKKKSSQLHKPILFKTCNDASSRLTCYNFF
jgi:hypothetical protein